MEESYKYILEHSTPQSEALDWIERQTHIRTNHARMLSGAVQGELMQILVKISSACKVLELGTFTGYSAVCLASALKETGAEDVHLDTLELNDELEDLILEGFHRAGVDDIVSLRIGDCKQTLKQLAAAGNCYDLIYIDANKREYCEYYALVFDMLRPGGLIVADNVLWDGKVWQIPVPQDRQTQEIIRFNDMVAADPRVECVILPLRDGLTLIRKK